MFSLCMTNICCDDNSSKKLNTLKNETLFLLALQAISKKDSRTGNLNFTIFCYKFDFHVEFKSYTVYVHEKQTFLSISYNFNNSHKSVPVHLKYGIGE
jgi:hypothetical protein